jgi:hypothetical protein
VFSIHSLTARNDSEQKSRMVANGNPETVLPIAPVTHDESNGFIKKSPARVQATATTTPQPDVVIPFEPGVTQRTDNQPGETHKRWF